MIYARTPHWKQNGVQHVSLCLGRINSTEGAEHSVKRRCLFSKFEVVKKWRINNQWHDKIGMLMRDVRLIIDEAIWLTRATDTEFS